MSPVIPLFFCSSNIVLHTTLMYTLGPIEYLLILINAPDRRSGRVNQRAHLEPPSRSDQPPLCYSGTTLHSLILLLILLSACASVRVSNLRCFPILESRCLPKRIPPSFLSWVNNHLVFLVQVLMPCPPMIGGRIVLKHFPEYDHRCEP
jgi:hypothetical protein